MALYEPSALANQLTHSNSLLLGSVLAADESTLRGDSLLPGWDRITVLCHLRYGAEASLRVTVDALANRETSYYPEGRAVERPGTLTLRPGEAIEDLVASLGAASAELDERWSQLDAEDWDTEVREPPGHDDSFGTVPLSTYLMLRLTEVEVHSTDLDLGLGPWSVPFVRSVLPMRLKWLATRRVNAGAADMSISGSWCVSSTEGLAIKVTADGPSVTVHVDGRDEINAWIGGTEHDLLAMMLGRKPIDDLQLSGDIAFAKQFTDAFPPP